MPRIPAARRPAAVRHAPVKTVRSISADAFFRDVHQHHPLIIRGGATPWAAARTWDDQMVHDRFGSTRVLVRQVRPGSPKTFIDQCMDQVRLVPLRQFVAYLRGETVDELPGAPGSWSMRESADIFVHHPALLADLAFQDLFPGRSLRFQNFLWLGPRGYVTGLHVDLIDLNILAHLRGRKTMHFFAPDQTDRMYPSTTVKSGVYSDVDPYRPDLQKHPRFAQAVGQVARLQPGDLVYVPRGWWHSAVAHTVTVSVTGSIPALV